MRDYTKPLTRRELEVLELVLEGMSSRQVADALCCSKRTVDGHLASIYLKLNVSNRVQAALRARSLGLLENRLAAHVQG